MLEIDAGKERMNVGAEGWRERCVLVRPREIRVCVCEGEREFSWREQAVQLCVCCIWSHAKNLLLATATP